VTAKSSPPPAPLWTLDLHGAGPARALQLVQQEIASRYPRGHSPGLIITGRGIHSEGGKSPVQAMVKKFLHSAEARNMGVKNVQPDGQGGAFRVDLYTPGQAPKPTPDR